MCDSSTLSWCKIALRQKSQGDQNAFMSMIIAGLDNMKFLILFSYFGIHMFIWPNTISCHLIVLVFCNYESAIWISYKH